MTARIIASHAKSLRELHRIKWYKEMRRLTRLATRQVDDWLKVKDVKKKQITKDMIMEEIASDDNMCGEYEALVREREELRRMRDVLDEFAKQWSKRFETLRSQLSALKAQREVKKIRESDDSQRFLAKKHGVSRRTIRDALSGRNWSHVE